MKVHVLNHTTKDIVVHRAGCADIEKERRKRLLNSDWFVEVPEGTTVAQAVVDELNADFGWPDTYKDENGNVEEPAPWALHNVTVMPCIKGSAK